MYSVVSHCVIDVNRLILLHLGNVTRKWSKIYDAVTDNVQSDKCNEEWGGWRCGVINVLGVEMRASHSGHHRA